MPPTHFPITKGALPGHEGALAGRPEVSAEISWAAIRAIVDSLPLPAVVVDRRRAILAASPEFRRLGESTSPKDFGEALGCAHMANAPSGCGTAPACSQCGAGIAILSSQLAGATIHRECSFETTTPERCEFEVIASPIELAGEPFTIVILREIREAKRRDALERVFLHDLLNTASGLQVLTRLLDGSVLSETQRRDYRALLSDLTTNLIDEIQHHRKLLEAERGDLQLRIESFPLAPFLEDIRRLCSGTMVGHNRLLRLASVPRETVKTDAVLLRRVIINLIKNALEATPSGGTVTLSCAVINEGFEFSVHNAGPMDASIQAQIFERPFSTKSGSGRGLGTYSVKLFVEKYLAGRVGFQSDAAQGTIFWFRIPKAPRA